MTLNQALEFLGTQANLARVLGVNQSAVANWKMRGEIPASQQFKLEIMSEGQMKADAKLFKK